MDTGHSSVSHIQIDVSEPNCRNVEQLIKGKETVFEAFMLARQLAQWGLKCLSRKIKNSEDEFPKDQEELLIRNIKSRIEDLKPGLIRYDNRALKRLGLILQEYVPGGDATFNKILMSGLQSTYSLIYDKMKDKLKNAGKKSQKKDALRRDWEGQVAQATGDPTVELYKPNPNRPSPMEEYLRLRMDVHSLFKIRSKIRQFLQESKFLGSPNGDHEYDLALQRLFHITGEYLKQTEMSPNLSVKTRETLMKKEIPVDALSEYRDMLAHYQLFPMIKLTIENRKELENTWRGVEKILENEISEMEENFFDKIVNEKTENAKRRKLKDIFEECKIKSVTCLMEKVKLEMIEDASQSPWSPEAVDELNQYAARMKSNDFPKQTAAEDVIDQFEIVPDTKNAIVDFIIASKKMLYDDIHRELKGRIYEEKYSLPESVKDQLTVLLKNHEYDMDIMKVRNILSHGGTVEKESLEDFFRKLPADISVINEANNFIIVKNELKKYFISDEISNGLVWDPPNEAKLSEARSLLQNEGEPGKKVMEFLTTLHKSQEGEVITFTPNDYKEAVDNLENVNGKVKEKIYSISIEWKKNECAKLLNYYFTDLMPLYDEILGKRDIKNRKNKESEMRVKELSKEVLPITAELYNDRVKVELTEMIPLENPSAVESQALNVVELLKRSKDVSGLLEQKSTKRKNTSKELGNLETSTEEDILKFRNYLAHGDALATHDKEVQMAEELVKLKDNIKGELAKAASEDNKIEFDKIGDMIDQIYPAGALAIKEILCPNSGKPNKRPRKARKVESCLKWEDIEEVVDGREGSIDPDNIKIDSEKMMDVLNREIHMNEEKFKNYISLTTESEVKGSYRKELARIVHHELTYGKHLENVEKFSGAAMHGMMAKNILGDILRGDYKDVEVDLGFLGGSFLLGEVSKIAARNGATFVKEGSVMLGESLKLASPLLSRGVSVFIAYDLWNQIKALKSGDKDAIVSVVGDSIQLVTDATEVGIEIAEGLSLIEGVSAVTGPIGMAIGATVFVGTEIYKAVKAVENIDKNIHLNGLERFNEGVRAFIGINPSLYINNIIEDKEGNNAAVQNAIRILKSNPHIQKYVFPSFVHVGCYEPMTALRSVVRLNRKVNNIEWSRSRPDDVVGVNIFCKPKRGGERVPNSWAYHCENAIGVEYNKDRTDNYTLINLGRGDDWVEGFQESGNIFIIDRHNKTLIGGSKDDSFIFHRDPTLIQVKKKKSCKDPIFDVIKSAGPLEWVEGEALEHGSEIATTNTDTKEATTTVGSKMVGYINGAEGVDTIDVEGLKTDSDETSNVEEVIANFPQKSLTYADEVAFSVANINKFLGTTRNPDLVVAACDTTFIDGRGGYNEHALDVIRIPDQNCSYNTTIIINPFTNVTNDALSGNFQYFIQGDIGKFSQINLKRNSKINNTFTFKYALDDLAAVERSRNTVKFSFVEFYDTFDNIEHQNSFNLTISEGIEGNTYLLMDNTRIVVGKHNLYAMQNTDRPIISIVEEYTDLMINLNMYLVVHSNNEVLTISGPQNDILTNDPTSETSHFVSGAGENIFSFISGRDKLTMKKLFINDVVIHYFNKNNSIDRLDLRKILAQVRKDLKMEVDVIVRGVKNDLILNLFISDERKSYELLRIKLKNVIEYLWYTKIQIVLDTVFSIENFNRNFKLVPQPLIFSDPDDTLFVINPKDVADGMKIRISKELKNYIFTRKDDALIITNSLNADSHKYSLVTVVLNGFYADDRHGISRKGVCDKMVSLSIEFDDKTVLLGEIIETFAPSAGDFLQMRNKAEFEAYRNLLQAMRKNRQLYKEINSGRTGEAADIIYKNEEFLAGKDGWVNPLAHAVIEGNMHVAVRLTGIGDVDVTAKDIYGHSPLYYALKYQQQEMIDYFLHTLFYRKSTDEITAIMTAITSELPVVKYVTQKLKYKNEADWQNFIKCKKDTGAILLHYAAINGNLDVVRYLIEEGGLDGNYTMPDRRGQTPLNYAVKYNHSSIVDYFMQIIRTTGVVPLSFGVEIRSLEVVQYLIQEKGADLYEKDKLGKTPLFYAFKNNAGDTMDYLIELIKKEGEGQVLAYPIITGDMTVLESMMKMNVPVNKKNALGKTPLHYAAMYGNAEMVELLVNRNADLKMEDRSGRTPLEYGVKSQHAEVVEFLCRKLNLDPLVTAAKAGKVRLVKKLIKDKTDLGKTDGGGNTLLHLAVQKGAQELVRFLVQNGSTPNARNLNSQTPLHSAAENGSLEIVKMLISSKADVNARDRYGRTPLEYALENQRTQVIIYLCEVKGVDALLVASKAGSIPTVKYLVENGANINKRDEKEQTILHLAVISQELEVVEYLVKSGMDPNVRNKEEQTPLHYVAMYGLLQIGENLIQKGGDVNSRDNWGWTPLYWVIDKRNNFQLLELLVDNGSDLRARDVLGRTPLSLAEGMDGTSEFTLYLKRKTNEKRRFRKRRQVNINQKYRKSHQLDRMTDDVLLGADTTLRLAHPGFPSWMNSSLNRLLHFTAGNTSQNTLSQISPEMDANGTIMLLDLLIRKTTGQKYVGTPDRVKSPLEIQALALNVVQIFEDMLNSAASEFSVDIKDLNFDPIALQSTITRQLRNGESSEIPKTLYAFAKEACSGSNQCDQFLDYLIIHLQQDLGKKSVAVSR